MQRKTGRMPDVSFRMMLFLFNVVDFFHPYIAKRVKKFGIKEGMTVVDYGCGPGRYTTKLAELVGEICSQSKVNDRGSAYLMYLPAVPYRKGNLT